MPDYVWALHDFVPENPDEVPFKIGDKIEVVERDDLYQDGWWQVSLFADSRHCDIGGGSEDPTAERNSKT